MADLERDELGERYLRSMHRHAGVLQALAEGVTRDSFKFGCQRAWDFFVDFHHRHKRLPHLSDIRDRTGVDLRSVKPEPYQYISRKLRDRKQRDRIFESLEEVAIKAEDGDVDVAMALLVSRAQEFREEADAEATGTYNESFDAAVAAYDRQFKGADTGTVKTPWETLNRALGNLAPGTLTVFLASPGVGKAIPIDTPIPTPSGWRRLKDLKAGDQVYSREGTPCSILWKSPVELKKTYRLTFNDGTVQDACPEHQWWAYRIKSGNDYSVVTTETLKEWCAEWQANPGNVGTAAVPIADPVEYPERRLPIDPYFLGFYLGDGHSRNRRVTEVVLTVSLDELDFVTGRLTEAKIPWSTHQSSGRTGAKPVYIKKCHVHDYFDSCGLTGMQSDQKFIPADYLVGSVEQRLDLLRGLMDSDGSPCAKTSSEYSTASPQLAKDVARLVDSLGISRSAIRERVPFFTHKGERRDGRKSYRIQIKKRDGVDIYSCPRKLALYQSQTESHRSLYRRLENVEELPSQPMQCIAVDCPDKSYLCGFNYLVTHNSWSACSLAYWAARQGKRVYLVSMEMTRSQIARRIDSILCEVPFSDLRDIGTDPSTLQTYLEIRRKLPFRRRALKGDITIHDERKIQTPEQLLAEGYKGNYDFVIVDGSYRMETGDKWDNTFDVQRKVAKRLQQYAKVLKVPFAVTSQYNEQNDTKGQRKTQMSLENARYSKEFGTNADAVIGLQPKSEVFGEYCLEFQLLKIREGSNKCERSFVANWNVNARLFHEKFGERVEEVFTEDDTDSVYGDL